MPVYLLNNALEHNHQASALYLSENPWRCECVFTFRFQELLQRHRELIKDVSDIRCEHLNDDGNIIRDSVLALKRNDICKIDEPAIRPIDWLNIVLAILIVSIVSKLSYDYYYYRKYGRLPWIVTKMPWFVCQSIMSWKGRKGTDASLTRVKSEINRRYLPYQFAQLLFVRIFKDK